MKYLLILFLGFASTAFSHDWILDYDPSHLSDIIYQRDLDVDALDEASGRTMLHTIVTQNRLDLAEMLLFEYRADVGIVDRLGMTATHVAAALGHTEMLRLIYDYNPFAFEIPSTWAAIEIAMDLVEAKAAHFATYFSQEAALRVIFELDSRQVDARNFLAQTPTHVAVGLGSNQMLATILSYAPDLITPDAGLQTPLAAAFVFGDYDQMQLIINERLRQLLQGEDRQELIKLLWTELTPPRRAAKRRTRTLTLLPKLHGAVLHNHDFTIMSLLRTGQSSLNGRDASDRTALKLAMMVGANKSAYTLFLLAIEELLSGNLATKADLVWLKRLAKEIYPPIHLLVDRCN